MLFDHTGAALRKSAYIGTLPVTPETGWRPVSEPPNLQAACEISFDVETYDPQLNSHGPGWARGVGEIVGVGIGARARDGARGKWYLPIRHRVDADLNLPAASVLKWTKQTLETLHIPKVGANILYDVGWLTEENIFVQGELHDVQFAEALLDEEALVALGELSNKYLGYGKVVDAVKDWIMRAYGTPEKFWRRDIYRTSPKIVGHYGEGDVEQPLDILPLQRELITRQGLDYIYRLECDLVPLLVRMRRAGVTVDVAKAEEIGDELLASAAETLRQISHEYGFDITATHSGAVAKLFDHVGIKYPSKRTPKGKLNPSIEKNWLKELDHPLGDLINDVREQEKIANTFCKSYVINKHVNGKLFPQFHPLKGEENGTKVGRFGSSDPNLQNIPFRTEAGKRVRRLFIPDTGHIGWRKQDLSQIHYRLLAHYAVDDGDGSANALRLRYNQDSKTDYHMDVYKNVAPLMGYSLTDKDEIKLRRRPIKNVNFGLLYGQSQKRLAYTAGMSAEQAKTFFTAYFKAAPYVKPTMAAMANEAERNGFITTVLGRRVRFNLWEKMFEYGSIPLPRHQAVAEYGNMIRLAFLYRAVNYKFQGSEPDILKSAMRACHQSGVFEVTGVPRLTVHDELDWSVIDDTPQTHEAFEYVKYLMHNTTKLRVPVLSDATTGPNWGDAD